MKSRATRGASLEALETCWQGHSARGIHAFVDNMGIKSPRQGGPRQTNPEHLGPLGAGAYQRPQALSETISPGAVQLLLPSAQCLHRITYRCQLHVWMYICAFCFTYNYMYIYTLIYAYTQVDIYTYIYIYTYTHTHIHTH